MAAREIQATEDQSTETAEVSDASFQRDVIDRSHDRAVVVDFWAEWCGPCRALAPALEAAVRAHDGRIALVKVNTDDNQRLATEYNIRSIPAVKAFVGGKEVAEFVGVRDARFLTQWLDSLVPSEHAVALAQAHDEPSLRALLDNPEVGGTAAERLADLLLAQRRSDDARALLDRIKDDDKAAQLRARLAILADARPVHELAELRRSSEADASATAATNDSKARANDALWTLAASCYAAGDVEAALSHWLSLVTRERKQKDDRARRAMLCIFAELGSAHSLTSDYRRRLMMAL